jgi:hypothetical protein
MSRKRKGQRCREREKGGDVEKEKRAAMSRKRKGRRCREREKGGDVEKEKRPARRAFHVLFSGIREHGLRRKLPNVVTAGYHSELFLLANSKGLVFVLARISNPRLSDGNTERVPGEPRSPSDIANFFPRGARTAGIFRALAKSPDSTTRAHEQEHDGTTVTSLFASCRMFGPKLVIRNF